VTCREETEQARVARDQEQAEGWAEAVARAGGGEAKAGEAVLPQGRGDTVSAPTAVKR